MAPGTSPSLCPTAATDAEIVCPGHMVRLRGQYSGVLTVHQNRVTGKQAGLSLTHSGTWTASEVMLE